MYFIKKITLYISSIKIEETKGVENKISEKLEEETQIEWKE